MCSVYQSQILSDSIDSQLPYRKDNWRLCFGIRTRGSSRTHDGAYHSSPFCEPEGFRVEKLGDKCECVHMYHGCGFSWHACRLCQLVLALQVSTLRTAVPVSCAHSQRKKTDLPIGLGRIGSKESFCTVATVLIVTHFLRLHRWSQTLNQNAVSKTRKKGHPSKCWCLLRSKTNLIVLFKQLEVIKYLLDGPLIFECVCTHTSHVVDS